MNGGRALAGSAGARLPDVNRRAATATWAVRAFGATAAVIGGVYFALWLGGIPPRWSAQGVITMKTNMAFALCLAGAALLLLGGGTAPQRRRAVAIVASALVLVIGVATFAEHLFSIDLGIDQLLATEPPGAPGVASPNRMGPPGALTLALLGAGLLALAWNRGASAYFGVAACCVELFPTVGFLYGVGALHAGPLTAITWQTVLGLLSLGVGLSIAVPRGGTIPLLWRDDPGGRLLRRMVVPAVLLPIAINFVRLAGERRDLYERTVGGSLYVVAIVIGYLLVLWRSAVRLSVEGAKREEVEQQARWRAALIDLAHDAIFVWSRERGIESWNRGAEELYGYTATEAVGRVSHEFLGTVFPRPWTEIEAELNRNGWWHGELRHRAKAGEQLTVSAKLQVVTAADGTLRVFETVRDITNMRRTADQVAAEKARLAVTLRSIGDAVIATDETGHITVINSVAEQLTGWTAGEALNRALDDVFHIVNEETRQPAVNPVDRVLREGIVVGLANHTVVVARDGTERPIADSAAPIRERGGRTLGVVLVFRDQTEERQAEHALRESAGAIQRANEQLREADHRKNEFLGVLSHELRNPLAPIRNAVYVLGHTNPGSEQAERARAIIARQVDHLTRLVEDLLEVRRIASGKLRLRTALLDVVQQVGETVEDMRPLFVQHGLTLEFHAPPQPVHVNGDRTRIAQVVGNLLHNALKFTDRGGSVSVAVETQKGQAIIRVRDSGVGIGPDMVTQLFDPFVQSYKTLDRSRGGLGLGLALVRGIAELHGGTITAHSEGVGKGAEFVVTLPAAAEIPVEAREGRGAAADGSKRRVLVVEDNVDAAESLRDLLEVMAGHEVHVATDGHAGVDAAREFTPHVVVCDIGLPGIDGYEVARRIRANGAADGARLVALSGYASAEDTERALRAGFDYHLAKPPDAERLLALVADATPVSKKYLPRDLATGHHELDSHHASILAEAAKLRAGVDAGSVLDSLRLLERHVVADFDYEEEAMEYVRYPDLDLHREQHREFLNQLHRLQEQVRGVEPTPGNVGAVAQAVEAWLPNHVVNEDRRFTDFIDNQRASPADTGVRALPTR